MKWQPGQSEANMSLIARCEPDNKSQRINSKKPKRKPLLNIFPPKDSTGKTPLGMFFSKGLSLFISVPQVFKNPALAVDSLLGIDFIRLHQPGLSP